MNLIETIILGLVQGLTEFIPISSSGHLVFAQALMGHQSSHIFLEAINTGTFLALLVYFFPRIVQIVTDIFTRRNYRLFVNILITSLPAGAVGFALSDFIDSSPFFGSVWVVVATLLLVGIVMVRLEKLPKLSDKKSGDDLPKSRAFAIGAAQMLALIPGVSRSGSTIIAGRLMGLSAKNAAEYSFLASLPIMAGVTLKVLLKDSQYLQDNASMLLVGNLVAFISGIIAVKFLMNYLASHSLAFFGWYRIGLSAIIAVVLLIQ